MSDLARTLLSLKKDIKQKELEKAESDGRLNELLRRLSEEFQCNNEAEAHALLQEFEEEIELLELELQHEISEIKKELEELK